MQETLFLFSLTKAHKREALNDPLRNLCGLAAWRETSLRAFLMMDTRFALCASPRHGVWSSCRGATPSLHSPCSLRLGLSMIQSLRGWQGMQRQYQGHQSDESPPLQLGENSFGSFEKIVEILILMEVDDRRSCMLFSRDIVHISSCEGQEFISYSHPYV